MGIRTQEIKTRYKKEIIKKHIGLYETTAIAREVGVSPPTIVSWLKEWGVWKSKRRENKILDLHLSGWEPEQIAPFVGVNPDSIIKIIRRKQDKKYKKKYINHNAFDNIYEQNTLYWLGYLAGDGTIYDPGNNRGKRISLSSKDKQIIKSFKEFVGSNHPIGKTVSRYNTNMYRLTFTSNRIAEILASVGITERKSMNLAITDSVVISSPDFIRGVIDADGWIEQPRYKICIISASDVFAEQLNQSLINLGIKSKIEKRTYKTGTYNHVIVSRAKECAKLIKAVNYHTAKNCLERKRERALDVYERASRYLGLDVM